MSTILDAITDAFFGVINFFANLSITRYDEGPVADWKRRKISCVVSTTIWAIVVIVLLITTSLLESLATNSILGPMVDASRETLGCLFIAGFAASSLYLLYTYYELWRFAKAEKMLDS